MLTSKIWLHREDGSKGPLLERVLISRGFVSDAERRQFLAADYELPDPFQFAEMDRACALVSETVSSGGRIVVFSDYDCDGLTAAAILWRYFAASALPVQVEMPDRAAEGYGLKPHHVEKILADRPALLITVDNGTTSREEVARLRAGGVKVIVTDHHQPGDHPAEADAHLNPAREQFDGAPLCGAVVALCLCQGLSASYPDQFGRPDHHVFRTLGCLAAVGTVADIMPLTGSNRRLVREALENFAGDAPAGLISLCGDRIDPGRLTARDIAFGLAPRINAASRVGEARDALRLLLTDDAEEADTLALRLDAWNEERRQLENEITEQALEQATADDDLERRLVVVWGENWHPGVIGIVASRLVGRFGKPALVIAVNGDTCQGSARAFGDFDVTALIATQAEWLDSFGGHRSAAGLSLPRAHLEPFVASLQKAALSLPYPHATVTVDAVLTIDDLSEAALGALDAIEPVGHGNEKVQAALLGASIESIRLIGDGSHISLSLLYGGRRLRAVGFGMALAAKVFRAGDFVDLVVVPSWRVFRGVGDIDLKIVDLRFLAERRQDRIVTTPADAPDGRTRPSTDDVRALAGQFCASDDRGRCLRKTVFPDLYRALAGHEQDMRRGFFLARMARLIERDYNMAYTEEELAVALTVFEDAGLGSLTSQGRRLAFRTGRRNASSKRPLINETEMFRGLEQKGRVVE